MAVSDNMTEDCFTSGINFIEFGQVGVMLSPEDVAWVDSCLTGDVEVLGSGWNYMRDALLETVSGQHETSAHGKDEFFERTEMEIFHPSEETWGMHDEVKSNFGTAVSNHGAKLSSGNKLSQLADDFQSKYSIKDVRVPSYSDSLRDLGISDLETSSVHAFQLDQSTEDIFRIWDLSIPPEDDDFIKQLNGTLAEISLEPTPPGSDHSLAWEGRNDESIDDLISGVADLSLSTSSC